MSVEKPNTQKMLKRPTSRKRKLTLTRIIRTLRRINRNPYKLKSRLETGSQTKRKLL